MTAIRLVRKDTPDRLRAKGDDEPCLVCGRKVNLERAASVHLTIDGLVPVADATDYGAGDQGWFSVGPDCAKDIPKEYRS